MYLINESQADWFIRDVIRGDEPRSSSDGVHLLRVGDWKLRSRDGLAVGMLLTLYSSKYGATDLRVVSVTAGTALIENDYGDPPLTKGTRVYSRIPDTVETRGR